MNEHENVNTQRVENGVAYDPLLGFFNLPQVETTAAPIEQVADDTKLIPGPQPVASAVRTGSFGGTKAGSGLRLYTAEEFAGSTPDKVDWLCEPYVAVGAITSIDGKPKVSGKTTFVTHMCGSVLEGKPFMGYPTTKTKVIYLTEQTDATFKTALGRAGLVDREDFFILPWGETLGIKWPDIVRFAVNEAKAKGARLLVVDTLSQFAGIRGDGENDAGAALDAARPLQEAAACGLAVVVLRHERKSGGEVGDSGRGSSAFAGAVDLVMSLRRCEGNVRPTIREIHAVGRFHETPNKLAVELTNEGYKALGSDAAVAEEEAREAILRVLPETPDEAMTEKDMLTEVASDGIKRTVAQSAIKDMLDDEVIARMGRGVKGEPYRYWRVTNSPSRMDFKHSDWNESFSDVIQGLTDAPQWSDSDEAAIEAQNLLDDPADESEATFRGLTMSNRTAVLMQCLDEIFEEHPHLKVEPMIENIKTIWSSYVPEYWDKPKYQTLLKDEEKVEPDIVEVEEAATFCASTRRRRQARHILGVMGVN